jgi:hypothetical protein
VQNCFCVGLVFALDWPHQSVGGSELESETYRSGSQIKGQLWWGIWSVDIHMSSVSRHSSTSRTGNQYNITELSYLISLSLNFHALYIPHISP